MKAGVAKAPRGRRALLKAPTAERQPGVPPLLGALQPPDARTAPQLDSDLRRRRVQRIASQKGTPCMWPIRVTY